MTKPRLGIAFTLLTLLLSAAPLAAEERFPPPDFVETDYQMPSIDPIFQDAPRAGVFEYLDSAVLIAALALGAYAVFKKRSRRWIFSLMIAALFYFGFVRQGCVCSIGAIQNASLALFDTGYAIPLTIVIFLLAPLVLSLFYGRIFCGSVCPLGAIQDAVLFRPVRVPLWLESPLRLIAYTYLALAILFAATDSAFLICRYDPFIAFFRLSGLFHMVALGLAFLLIAAFIGRPYCRFLCPYGVLLRQTSRVSARRVTITPDDCIRCGLCEDACPFNAIQKPTPPWPEAGYRFRKKLFILSLILLPGIILLGGYAVSRLSHSMAGTNATVRLSREISRQEAGLAAPASDAARAFRESSRTPADLHAEAETVTAQFAAGAWGVGLFLGTVAGVKLIGLSIQKKRRDYTADPASCFACGRCYRYCPRQRQHDKSTRPPASEPAHD